MAKRKRNQSQPEEGEEGDGGAQDLDTSAMSEKPSKAGEESGGGPESGKKGTSKKELSEVEQRLQRMDAMTQRLVDTIPPKYYFEEETVREELEADKRSKFEGQKKKGKPLSAKAMHKKFKLDPDSKQTVSQIISSKFGSDDDEGQGKDEAWGRKVGLKKNMKKGMNPKADKMNALQEKLRAKIDAMSSKRKTVDMDEKKKRESKAKRKEKNRSKPGAKQKGFVKQKAGTSDNGTENTSMNGHGDEGGDSDGDDDGVSMDKSGEGHEHEDGDNDQAAGDNEGSGKKSKKKAKTPKIYNDEGKIIFSKFDFVAPPMSKSEEEVKGDKKKKMKLKNKKDLKKLLKKAEAEEDKIESLRSSGQSEEAEKLKSSSQWRAALAKSEGEKVRNKPELIKKTIKRMDKTKKKSDQKWKERTEATEARMESAQKKRQRHIEGRSKAKKDKKLTRLRKKGRIV
jgi:hypothetical protein